MATKKKVKRLRRGVIYRLTPKGLKVLAEISGQGKVVKQTLAKMGKANAANLIKRVGKKVKTKKPGNVIAAYLTKWRQKGLVAVLLPKKSK